MSFLLKQIYNLIYLLNSEKGTDSIAIGLAFGMVLGFSPVLSLQAVLVVLIVLLFRVQFGAVIVSMALFKTVAIWMNPVFHPVGEFVLSQPALEPAFEAMYNMPLVPLTRFYNTVVMGGGVVSLALVPVVYVVARFLIARYREAVVRRLRETWFWKFWKSTTLYKWYQKYSAVTGG